MNTDHFAHKAERFEQNTSHVDSVTDIARTLLAAVKLDPTMQLLDFGSGTGLLLERIAPFVARISAMDVSPAMNRQLEEKRGRIPCALEILAVDLVSSDLPRTFDGILSSMTLHHIADLPALLGKFHALLVPGGFIALADLDVEDGSFHSEDSGVFHQGIDREALAAWASAAGFTDIRIATASVITKPQRDYPVFLLTARR
jgi:cyclopropane fatty-acyl-phospholipid synthase-like methyltransferase